MSLQISGFTYFQESPDVKFFLLIPPNTRLDPSSTLLDSDCVPSSLVRFIPENFQRGTDPDTGLKIFAKKWRRNFCPKQQNLHYNGDLISNPLKSVNIWNTSFLKIGFQIVQFSKDQAIAMVPTIQNPDIFVRISNDLSWFQMVGFPDVRSHSKSRPFATQPILDHSKFRLGQISNAYCIWILALFNTMFFTYARNLFLQLSPRR